jgi:hypothetical protein
LDEGSSCEAAANFGHLKMLKWLAAKGAHITGVCSWNAAHKGHLEVLEWLRSKNYYIWSDAWHGASMGGHLEVMKWLRGTGIPWDKRTGSIALKTEAAELLKWLVAEDYPFFKDLSPKHRAKLDKLLK